MRKTFIVALGLGIAVVLPSMAAPVGAAAKEQERRSQRGELVHRIVMKWGNYIQEAYRADVREWAREMGPIFANASLDSLQRAADARNFDDMNDAFLDSKERSSIALNALVNGSGRSVSNKLGDVAGDLVFVPIAPCRIIDTRVAGGTIAANAIRDFDITGVSNYSFQGGDSTNCSGAGAAGSFAAAAINFTVVTPSAAGYITAFPFATTQPLAATVNYSAGDIRGNYAVVKLDQSAATNELSVYSFATTHLVADLVGYYIAPQPTELECVEKVSAGTTIAAGSFGTQQTASCDAGYTITGGGCSMSNFDGRVVTTRSIASGSSQTHFCAFRNEGAGTVEGIAYSRCCRTPGR